MKVHKPKTEMGFVLYIETHHPETGDHEFRFFFQRKYDGEIAFNIVVGRTKARVAYLFNRLTHIEQLDLDGKYNTSEKVSHLFAYAWEGS